MARIWRRTNSLGRSERSCSRCSCLRNASKADSIWRIQPGTQMAPCSITPIFSARVPLEHAVEDHRGERLGRRSGDGHVVDRAEVLVAAVEVGDVGAAVHEVLRVRAAARRRRRGGRSGCRPPRACRHTGSSPMWLGEWSLRAAARDEQRRRAHRDAPRRPWPPRGRSRPAARSRWAAAGRSTEQNSTIAAVVGAGGAVGEVEVAAALEAQQVAVVEGVEHELAGHAEQVEGERPVGGDRAAGRLEVLAGHDLLGVAGPELRVGVPGLHLGDGLGLAGRQAELHVGSELLPHRRIGVLQEPGGLLHDVGVGVVHDPALDVRHHDPPVSPAGGRLGAEVALLRGESLPHRPGGHLRARGHARAC